MVSTTSLGNDASTFSRDRDAVRAIGDALANDRKKLVFTSGSAVFGTFSGGNRRGRPRRTRGPAAAEGGVRAGFGEGAPDAGGRLRGRDGGRVDTEWLVLADGGVQGIVVRPGLVYGHGGSFGVPTMISLARAHGHGVHLGAGATIQGFVHIDDLAELYHLAVESAPAARSCTPSRGR